MKFAKLIDPEGRPVEAPEAVPGSVSFDAQVVTFSGGGFDGWRGARSVGDNKQPLIIFREDHANPKAGETIHFKDTRCARHAD